MKKTLAVVAILCIATTACAQQKTFTGADYLKLNEKQKITTVSKMINEAGAKGIAIQHPPKFYCEKLETFYGKAPTMKEEPFATVLKTLMIMEYDWDQVGVNKEDLAKRTLGEDLYKANKTRLGK